MAHTPGPWIAAPRSHHAGEEAWEVYTEAAPDADGDVYPETWVCEYVTEDDARLIAAAPDLLEALEDIAEGAKEAYDARDVGALLAVHHVAATVLAKAKGAEVSA